MKKAYRFIAVSLISAVACVFFVQGNAYADDWDDAGKILAGVVGGYIGHEVLGNIFGGSSYYYRSPYSYHRQRYCYYRTYPRSRRYFYIYVGDDDHGRRHHTRYRSRHHTRHRRSHHSH